MKDLETMQREGREHFIKEYCVKRPAQEIRWIRSVFLDDEDQIETILCEMDRHTANTWKACLATILESGLLEELDAGEAPSDNAVGSEQRTFGSNRTKRAIKAHLDELIKSTQ